MTDQESADVVNFGGNVRFHPRHRYTPTSEDQVLEILDRHRGESIRAVGRLHSWSDAPTTRGVMLDLRNLNQVRVQQTGDAVRATVGAGCQIKRMLSELRRLANVTSPSVGLITEQTIAGAISTGTHGSGKHSLSHYMDEIRIATYDSEDRPVIRTFDSGDPLRAARCSLGALGIILSVSFECRPAYWVEEHARRHPSVQLALAEEEDYPLQQFFVIPWLWAVYAQHRREVTTRPSWLAPLYRLYWLLCLDIGLHLVILTLAKLLRSASATQFFFARTLPWLVIQNWTVVDDSEQMLVMEHELFRHIEIEVFVPAANLLPAIEFLKDVIRVFGGRPHEVSETTRERLQQLDLWQALLDDAGQYCHHYPICIRRVLADDTLISMASGHETYYSISLISYQRKSDRDGFSRFARFVANSMSHAFSARIHWGKLFPHDAETLRRLYPRLDDFQRICAEHDPRGVFRNRWLAERLDYDPS